MLELFVPYLVAALLEMPLPAEQNAVAAAVAADQAATLDTTAMASDREPEDQTPTGSYLNATEVKPILNVTKPQWVAVRLYEGQDWVYFTNLMSWRCGLWEVRYGINGAPPETVLPMEPCYTETAAPNSFVDNDLLPFVTFPPESVASLTVEVTYDDGTTDTVTYERAKVLIP